MAAIGLPGGGLGVHVDPDGVPHPSEPVRARARALVEVHGSVDPADGRPLRLSDGDQARLLPLAAGVGHVAVTPQRLVGTVLNADRTQAVVYAMAWGEVDDIGGRPLRFLSTSLVGAVTVDVIGPPSGRRRLEAAARRARAGW
jgi:hypothetical protein